MRVGSEISYLGLLSLVMRRRLSACLDWISTLRLRSPIRTTSLHSDATLSIITSMLESTSLSAFGALYIFPSRMGFLFSRISIHTISIPSITTKFGPRNNQVLANEKLHKRHIDQLRTRSLDILEDTSHKYLDFPNEQSDQQESQPTPPVQSRRYPQQENRKLPDRLTY